MCTLQDASYPQTETRAFVPAAVGAWPPRWRAPRGAARLRPRASQRLPRDQQHGSDHIDRGRTTPSRVVAAAWSPRRSAARVRLQAPRPGEGHRASRLDGSRLSVDVGAPARVVESPHSDRRGLGQDEAIDVPQWPGLDHFGLAPGRQGSPGRDVGAPCLLRNRGASPAGGQRFSTQRGRYSLALAVPREPPPTS